MAAELREADFPTEVRIDCVRHHDRLGIVRAQHGCAYSRGNQSSEYLLFEIGRVPQTNEFGSYLGRVRKVAGLQVLRWKIESFDYESNLAMVWTRTIEIVARPKTAREQDRRKPRIARHRPGPYPDGPALHSGNHAQFARRQDLIGIERTCGRPRRVSKIEVQAFRRRVSDACFGRANQKSRPCPVDVQFGHALLARFIAQSRNPAAYIQIDLVKRSHFHEPDRKSVV